MKLSDVDDLQGAVGMRVRALRAFMEVPQGAQGAQGVVDESYTLDSHQGVMVAWDLPENPLPAGYKAYGGRPLGHPGLLRDGFGRGDFDETQYLEVVGGVHQNTPQGMVDMGQNDENGRNDQKRQNTVSRRKNG